VSLTRALYQIATNPTILSLISRVEVVVGGAKQGNWFPLLSTMDVFEQHERVIARDSLGNNYESKVLEVEDRKGVQHYYVHYDGWNSRWDEWITADRMMKLTEENKVLGKVKTKMAAGRRKKQDVGDEEAGAQNTSGGQVESDEEERVEVVCVVVWLVVCWLVGCCFPTSPTNEKSKLSKTDAAMMIIALLSFLLLLKSGFSLCFYRTHTHTHIALQDAPPARRGRKARAVEERRVPITTTINVNIPPLLKRMLYEDWKNVCTMGYLVSVPRRPSVFDVLKQVRKDC
jgi:hypothetical protein